MEKLDLTTPNITDENVQKIAKLFPNCVTEADNGKTQVVDFDALKQELASNIVEGNKERYQLSWPGKAESLVMANTPINKTLRPNRKESKDFDNTENLYIEGDNLEVLKLLQETYLGKIKMIYIDPPYNTGNDFVYKDNFTQDKSEYDEESGNIDDEGGRLVSNPDSNGRYHSDWLSMMYPRLKLARNLLKDDGVIFISIDDNEVHNLRKICDEVFGEENFINMVAVKMSEATGVKMAHARKRLPKLKEYLLLYKKSKELDLDYSNVNIPLEKWGVNYKSVITNITNQEIKTLRKLLKEVNITDKQMHNFDSIAKNIKLKTFSEVNPNWSKLNEKERLDWKFENAYRIVREVSSASAKKISDIKKRTTDNDFFGIKTSQGKLYFIKNHYNEDSKDPNIKLIFAVDYMMVNPCDFWSDIKTTRLDQEGEMLFNNGKKPLKLLRRVLNLITKESDIILDFFSGSASTAHAAMMLNAKDNGNRKYIMVQIPESINEKLETYEDGYKTIAEIGKERIRRAGEKIKEDNADKEDIDDLDIGFRVLKVDSSNMKDVYFSPDDTSQEDMFDRAENIKVDRDGEDLLFMVLLDWGIDLSVKIECREIAEKTVYFADDNFLAACFEENLDEDFVKALVKEQPLKVVLRDSGFASSSVKINVEQIFKQADIEVKVI